jgi:hypothetical protein
MENCFNMHFQINQYYQFDSFITHYQATYPEAMCTKDNWRQFMAPHLSITSRK